MAIDSTLPLMFAQQMGAGGRLVNEMAMHPEMTQYGARQAAEVMLRQQASQVQKTDESALSTVVDDGEHDADGFLSGQHTPPKKQADEEAETSPSTEGPFLGNLVNCKA